MRKRTLQPPMSTINVTTTLASIGDNKIVDGDRNSS